MGVKVLLCFPFYRRCKERCKDKECPPETEPAVPKVEPKQRLCSTTSISSECDSVGSPQAYFSQKARLSFRHQMDSNFNAIDATY
ncbi:uncharacterized protein C17orf114-like [Clarias gariepinus]